MTILEQVQERLRLHPQAPAIDEAGRVLSYAGLEREVEELAGELRSQGSSCIRRVPRRRLL